MKNPTKSSAHTEGPWNTFDYGDKNYPWIIIENEQGFHVAVVERGNAKNDPSAANACLIAQAPELLKLVRSFRCSCEDRIAILREEGEQDYVDKKDIDAQIGHWSVLLKRCESVLDNAV